MYSMELPAQTVNSVPLAAIPVLVEMAPSVNQALAGTTHRMDSVDLSYLVCRMDLVNRNYLAYQTDFVILNDLACP